MRTIRNPLAPFTVASGRWHEALALRLVATDASRDKWGSVCVVLNHPQYNKALPPNNRGASRYDVFSHPFSVTLVWVGW
jgi:hypothetical protein